MTITLRGARRLTTTALTVVTAAGAALTTAAPTTAAPDVAVATTAITERGHQAGHPIFLVTGEQVLAGAGGVSVLGAPGGFAGQLVKLSMGGETYVMPV